MRPTSTRKTPDPLGGLRPILIRLFRAAVDAVAGDTLVARHLRCERRRLLLIGDAGEVVAGGPLPDRLFAVGKAAGAMARACAALPELRRVGGMVLVPDGGEVGIEGLECAAAGHPLPDRRGLDATARLLEHAGRGTPSASAVCLISGGASSLLVQPTAPVTLEDKTATNELLIESGASISEINAVRKHLSAVKGGGLLRRCRGTVLALLLSDVIGDDPAVIGSGPTVPDPTTFAEARDVLERFDLLRRVPETVRTVLASGVAGRIRETVKPADPEASRSASLVIGSNATARAAAAESARAQGWRVELVEDPVAGDTTDAAVAFAGTVRNAVEAVRRDGLRRCIVAGGETTVRVVGPGRGGRNQEFALALAPLIDGMPVAVLSAGTDGVDGPTDAAGAFADGTTVRRSRACGLDPRASLSRNDSHTFFGRLGDRFSPGPTGTNVMDLKLALIRGA